MTPNLKEIDAEYGDVLLHSNVRWLSRGRVLNRFVALLEEIRYFLINRGKQFDELNDNDWLLDLAFMADLSTHLSRLNLTLQGEQHLLPDLVQSVVAFRGMLHLLLQQIKSNDYTHFPSVVPVRGGVISYEYYQVYAQSSHYGR